MGYNHASPSFYPSQSQTGEGKNVPLQSLFSDSSYVVFSSLCMVPSEKHKKAGNTQEPAPSTVFSFSLLQRTEVRTAPSGTRRCLRYYGGHQVNWENQCHFFTTTEATSLSTSSLLHCSSPSSRVTWPELAVHSLISCPGEPPPPSGSPAS